jgi:hypothetical protein
VTVSPTHTAAGDIVAAAVGVVCGGGLIVTVSVLLPVPPAFVALMVPLYVPAVLGVPENNPVAVLKFTPGTETVVP